jgi:hypothetical protein
MKSGTNTGSVERSPERAKREARKRRRQEAAWAARNGPVTVRRVDPDELRSSR